MHKEKQNNKNRHIHVMPTEKFKTTTITFKFMAPLDYETITARSLLSKVLVRATKKWPTDKDFNKQLSELYGAYINSFVSKFKDKHVITISLEIVNERYLKDTTPFFEKGRGPTIRMSNYEKMWNKLQPNTSPNAASDVLSRHVMNLAKHLNLHNTKLENLSHS